MKKNIIAVIDSWIDTSAFDENITSTITLESREKKSNYLKHINNSHGTDVIKIILRESSNIEILAIPVLNENNRGTFENLIEAIKFCIEKKVTIINLSLGFLNIDPERKLRFENLCRKAHEIGIIIITANHNKASYFSYPANLSFVISVDFDFRQKKAINVDRLNHNIIFSHNYVLVMSKYNKNVLRKGNSYLAPIITGLCSEYIKNSSKKNMEGFFDFLENTLSKNQSKIWITKQNQLLKIINKKNILYCKIGDDDIDNKTIQYYSKYSNLSIVNLTTLNKEKIENQSPKIDLLFIGNITSSYYKEIVENMNMLINNLKKNKQNLVMIIPAISIYERLLLAEKDDIYVVSFYY